jgi:hypothetical protein
VLGCEYCVPEEDAQTLMLVPRERAPERLMDRYGFKAVMAGFETWPEEERATVRTAFLALWRLWLNGGRPWRRPWRDPFVGPADVSG